MIYGEVKLADVKISFYFCRIKDLLSCYSEIFLQEERKNQLLRTNHCIYEKKL